MSRQILLIIICLSLGMNHLNAQRYSKRKILKDLNELSGFEQSFVGFMLVDPETGETIAYQYDDRYMTPASNTKLFTFYAGIHYLGNAIPAMKYLIKGDSLIFWGTGNPLFLHAEHNDTEALDFLNSRSENLFYWPRPMEDDRFGPGWGWDDYNGYYSAEKSVFPIYGNSITAYLNKEEKTIRVSPESFTSSFTEKLDGLIRLRSYVQRDEMESKYEYTFSDSLDFEIQDYTPVDTLVRPFRYSTGVFVKLLSDTLKREVTVVKKPEQAALAQTLYTIPSDTLYKKMLQPSDNLFAEQILLMASGLEGDTLNSMATIDKVKDQLFDDEPDELVWVDGSGLSRYNMFTPRSMAGLLLKLHKEVGEERLFDLLPAGGVSGTIEEWYAGEKEPFVFAKTGTIRNNHSLSGYVKTDSGKTLVFTFMVNHYEHSTDKVRKSMETMLNKIRVAY